MGTKIEDPACFRGRGAEGGLVRGADGGGERVYLHVEVGEFGD